MIQAKQLVRRNRIGEKGEQLTINNHLPIHQKTQNGTPTPYLRPSDSIFLIYIRCRIDWCMIQAKQMVRRNRIVKKGAELTTMNHSPWHQKCRNGTPTPYLLLPDSIFLIYIRCRSVWCMLQAKQTVRRNRIGEKGAELTRHNHSPCTQKHRNGTPTPNLLQSDTIILIYIRCRSVWCMIHTKQTVRRNRISEKGAQLTRHNHLPIHQNGRNGTPTPNLRQSDSKCLIYIRCRSVWCMIQPKQTVRKNRNGEKGAQLNRINHSPCHPKRQNGTPTPYQRPSDSIILIYIRCRSVWCMIQARQMVRRNRISEKGAQLTKHIYLPINQNGESGIPHAKSTPIRQHYPHLHSMTVSLMYDTSKTNGEKQSNCWKRNRISQTQSLTLSPKTSKRNAHAKSTPVRRHIPDLHSIPVRLMYDTSKTNGEKQSNRQKRSTYDQQHRLTNPPKKSKRNAHAEYTPSRQRIPYLHSIPHRLRYDTSKTIG